MTGLHALITGASRGLGRVIAQEFLARGATVAVVDFNECKDLQAEVIRADLADPDAPARIVETLQKRWDHIDVLVNNAAIMGPIGPLWDNDWAEWERTIRINLLAPVALCRLVVPWMRRGGSIVNLSGGGATAPRPNFTAYGVAKAGVVRFTETLAHETAERGIRVNAIAPGAMNTELLEAVLRKGPAAGKEYEAAVRQKESGGQSPETAAKLVAYLASPESEGVTGRLISAIWDPWPTLAERTAELAASDIYTLRRITPEDRGHQWA